MPTSPRSSRFHAVATAAGPRPAPPAVPESGRRRSASGRDRPPGTARRAEWPKPGEERPAADRAARWGLSHDPSPAPSCRRQRRVRTQLTSRPVRRARSGSATGSACSADHRRSGSHRRHRPRVSASTAASTARSAARPAASGPASNSCSGGWMRGRTISARPSAVKPRNFGRSGSSARAVAKSEPNAARRLQRQPASRRRSRPTGSAA